MAQSCTSGLLLSSSKQGSVDVFVMLTDRVMHEIFWLKLGTELLLRINLSLNFSRSFRFFRPSCVFHKGGHECSPGCHAGVDNKNSDRSICVLDLF